MKAIMDNIIDALAERKDQINNSPHQDILIKIRDGKILICGDNILWKPKEIEE